MENAEYRIYGGSGCYRLVMHQKVVSSAIPGSSNKFMDWYASLTIARRIPFSKSKREQALPPIIAKWELYRLLKAIPLTSRSLTAENTNSVIFLYHRE
jgi:hypothetical protein